MVLADPARRKGVPRGVDLQTLTPEVTDYIHAFRQFVAADESPTGTVPVALKP